MHGIWCGALLLAGCGEEPEDAGTVVEKPVVEREWKTKEWTMARGGMELQGRVNDAVPVKPGVKWTFDAEKGILGGAAIADGVAIFGDQGGRVRALDLATREVRWTYDAGEAVDATPAISETRVYIGAFDKFFRALELSNGEEIWRIKGRYEFPTGATVVDGAEGQGQRVVVNGYDGITRCLRARDGVEIWQFETADYLFGTPAVIDGEWVTYGGCDAVVRKLRLSDGESAVEWEIDAQVTTTVATYDGVVFACSYGQEVVAVDVRAGKLKWVYEAEDLGFGTAPGVDEKAVYLGGEDKTMHAIERETGKGLWKFKAGGSIESAPLVFDDAVVFASSDGRLYAVEKGSGEEMWRLDLGEAVLADPAFADGNLVIGGEDGTVFVIGEAGED
jgi:outer membrane protein assembly factor BamB